MKFKPVFILLAILFFSLSTRGQKQDGSVFEKRVTLSITDQPLTAILDQLSWQAGVYFSYDAALFNTSQKMSVEASDKSLYTILNQLFNIADFKFTEKENQVIITRRIEKAAADTVANDTVPVKYFFLSSRIVDSKKGDPVVYASVSILNKPIGTITNTDGDFLLKIHPGFIRDTLIISCMGYAQILIPAYKLLDEDVIQMVPFSIRIKEVKVTATTPGQLLANIRKNLPINYCENNRLMTAFYRETVQQDQNYISVSEAVIEILKAPYTSVFRSDVVRLLKGRRSPDVKPFQWLNFKLQGGPFTITQLDAIKTMGNFLDEEFESYYSYNISKMIWYNDNPVYVLEFKPISELFEDGYVGEMYVHRETFAVVHINYYLNKTGLKNAENVLVRKKPKGVKAKPSYVNYSVSYQQFEGKWHLSNAQAKVKFKIRSKRDKINSEFTSVSDLLITDIQSTDLKRFNRDELINLNDIFVEMIKEYDYKFWENYNIIKPDEELQNAFKNETLQ